MKSLSFHASHVHSRALTCRIGLAALVLLLAWIGPADAQTLPAGCGTLTQSWGPFDYRADRYIPESTYRSHSALLAIVETAHFTAEVEGLFRGKTGALPGGDLSYTLGVFPNHHRALVAVSRLAIREKSPQGSQTRFTVECYFQRAIAFRPDDNLVRMIYANHLIQTDRARDAEAQIDVVASRNNENALTLRNIGLLYFEVKNFEKSLLYAHNANALGLNVDVLKEKLQKAGKWRDAPPQVQLAASAPASASASASASEPSDKQ